MRWLIAWLPLLVPMSIVAILYSRTPGLALAAAAVLLVIPAYVYHWKPIKEVVILGELLAISAIIMCGLFVLVDIGRPDNAWHLIPGLGRLNVPSSLLGWDVLVLNGYLLLNLVIVTNLLSSLFRGREPNRLLFYPLVLLSIPAAIGIHTVTVFLYNGFAARPFWNASILAPRFLASAFCSGPAVLLILMQLLRRFTRFEIQEVDVFGVPTKVFAGTPPNMRYLFAAAAAGGHWLLLAALVAGCATYYQKTQRFQSYILEGNMEKA